MTSTVIDQPPVKASVETVGIPVGKIDASPFNPRQHFDPEELQRLGASLKTDGQLQNCVVRPTGHRYELIAGERRWRAAKAVKLPTLRCVVVEVDDARAVELAGLENYQRAQLDALEVSRWFQSMLDQAGHTQASLAKKLGVTQSLVSQRLGLLDLPDAWQRRIITGVIQATWARDLVRWAKRPQVLKELDTLAYGSRRADPPENQREFREYLDDAIDTCSRPLKGHFCIRKAGGGFRSGEVAFKAGAGKRREQLDIEEVGARCLGGGSTKVHRAFNIELWDQLQAEGMSRRSASQAKAQDKLDRAAKSAPPSRVKAAKKKARDQFSKRLNRWKVQWLQGRIVEKIPDVSDPLLLRLLLHFTVQDSGSRGVCDLYDAIQKASPGKPVKGRSGQQYRHAHQTIGDLVKLDEVTVRSIAIELLHKWILIDVDGWRSHLTSADIEALAAALSIDVKRDWTLTRDYLELHTKDQLFALAREWKLSFPATKRGDIITGILKAKPTSCPTELLKVKGV